jgi:hypothetical protein
MRQGGHGVRSDIQISIARREKVLPLTRRENMMPLTRREKVLPLMYREKAMPPRWKKVLPLMRREKGMPQVRPEKMIPCCSAGYQNRQYRLGSERSSLRHLPATLRLRSCAPGFP